MFEILQSFGEVFVGDLAQFSVSTKNSHQNIQTRFGLGLALVSVDGAYLGDGLGLIFAYCF